MVSILVARAAAKAFMALDRPLARLHRLTSLAAGTREVKSVRIEVVVDREQLQRIVAHPDVVAGLELCDTFRRREVLRTCSSCGAVT
jgi:hypothetical protein